MYLFFYRSASFNSSHCKVGLSKIDEYSTNNDARESQLLISPSYLPHPFEKTALVPGIVSCPVGTPDSIDQMASSLRRSSSSSQSGNVDKLIEKRKLYAQRNFNAGTQTKESPPAKRYKAEWKMASSSSSSSSSGCSADGGSDCEMCSIHDDEILAPITPPHHDDHASPDSPDSGVSGSVNSYHEFDEEEHESTNILYNHYEHSSDTSSNSTENTSPVNLSNSSQKPPPPFRCNWFDCDWPGTCDDLPEHIREIHVELQPFLDSNGKLINWIHKKGNDDETSSLFNSDDEDGDRNDDEECLEEDEDSRSSTDRTTRSKHLYRVSEESKRTTRSCGLSKDGYSKMQNRYVCLWKDCKVYGKHSTKNWLERHVLHQHSGPTPFKCIVDSCGQRFKTEALLHRHVNSQCRLLKNRVASSVLNNFSALCINSADAGRNCGNNQFSGCCCDCHCHACLQCDQLSSSCNKQASPCSSKSPHTDYCCSVQQRVQPPTQSSTYSASLNSRKRQYKKQYAQMQLRKRGLGNRIFSFTLSIC